MIRTKLTRLRCDDNSIHPLSLYTFYGGQGILMTSGLVSLSLSLLHPLLSVYHASEAEQGATKNGSRSDDSIGYTHDCMCTKVLNKAFFGHSLEKKSD